MKTTVSSITVIAMISLTGCTVFSYRSEDLTMDSITEDTEAIQRLADDFRSGWLEGDPERLLSLYTDDAVLLPQDQPAVFPW